MWLTLKTRKDMAMGEMATEKKKSGKRQEKRREKGGVKRKESETV